MAQMTLLNVPASHCQICGRVLSDPQSVKLGIGPICRSHNHLGGDDIAQHTEKFHDHFIDEPINPNGLVLRRDDDGVWTNVPHLVVAHSPTGYEWGYGGSGPADLALNIVELLLYHRNYSGPREQCYDGTCFDLAYALHHDFKWRVIAPIPRDGETRIPYADLLDALNALYDERYGEVES